MKLKTFKYKEYASDYKRYLFYKDRENLTSRQKIAFLKRREISVINYEEDENEIKIGIGEIKITTNGENLKDNYYNKEYLILNKKVYGDITISNLSEFNYLIQSIGESNPLYKKFDWLLKNENCDRIIDIVIDMAKMYNYDIIYDILIGNTKGVRKLFKDISNLNKTPYIKNIKQLSKYNFNYHTYLTFIVLSSNPERDNDTIIRLCDKYYNGEFAYVRDLVDMSYKWGLYGTINFGWSLKRFKEEHDKVSIKIAELKMNHLLNNKVIYNEPLIEDDEFTILTTPIEFAHEASELCHCLFSNNYFDECINKNTLILSFKSKTSDQRGTAEINFMRDKDNIIHSRVAQFKGFKNKDMDLESTGKLHVYLHDNKDWFNRNLAIIDISNSNKRLCVDECSATCGESSVDEDGLTWEDRERIERERVESIINSPNQFI